MTTELPEQTFEVPPYTVADFAQDLETLLAAAERKASEWIKQRKAIQHRLTELRDTADRLLEHLSSNREHGVATVEQTGTLAIQPSADNVSFRKRPQRRRMSQRTKKRISAAQRRRWAQRNPGV